MDGREIPTKILIMDDEPLLRSVLFEGLVLSGYEVISTDSQAAAIQALESPEGKSVKLIITDYLAGDSSFGEFLDRLAELAPAIPVLVISGLDVFEYIETLHASQPIGFLQKPFSHLDLGEKIQKLLGLAAESG